MSAFQFQVPFHSESGLHVLDLGIWRDAMPCTPVEVPTVQSVACQKTVLFICYINFQLPDCCTGYAGLGCVSMSWGNCDMNALFILYWFIPSCYGHALARLLEALCCKLEGRGFYSQWGHWSFQLIQPFQPYYDPGIDSASHRNEYQESSWV
jgi:hypothetical protein